jgi:MFS family permease
MTLLALLWFVRTTWRRAVIEPDEVAEAGTGAPLRDTAFLWLLGAAVLLGMAFDTVYSTLGNYLRDYYHLSTEAIGWQFGLNAMLVVALQIPLTHWGERWGQRRQLLAGCVLLAVGLGMLPFGSGLFYVCLSTVIWTLGEAFFMPPMNVLVMQHAQGGKSGQYFGLFFMSWSASALLSPVLSGQLYGHFGGHSVWLASATLALLTLPLIYLATRSSTPAKALTASKGATSLS